MAVSFVAASSGTSAGSTSTSFATTLPTGWAAGDVAVLVGHISAASLTMTTPAGWSAVPGITNPTSEGTNSRIYAWYRVLQAGDTAPTITNSGSVTGGWDMAAYRGADQASPIAQAAVATAAAATTGTLPSLTGVGADAALHAFAHARVASGTIPTGLNWNAAYTESLDVATSRATTAANVRLADARRLVSTAGSYGGETVTVANSISSSMIVGLIEIKAGSLPSTVTLTSAALTLSAPPVSPAAQPVTVALAPAALALSAPPVTPAAQPVTVALAPAALALSAPAVSPGPPPATVTLTAATITLAPVAPVALSASGPVTVNLTPATITLSGVAVAATARPITRTLTPAALRLTAPPVAPKPLVITVVLTPAAITLAAVRVVPVAQSRVALAPAELRLDPAPVRLIIAPAAAHSISAAGQPHGVSARVPVLQIVSARPAAVVAATAVTQASVRRTA